MQGNKKERVGRMNPKVLWVGMLVCLVWLAGCGRPAAEALSGPVIVAQSVSRMKSLKGYEYLIQRSGGLVFLDADKTVGFSRAQGQYVSPDRVSANVRLIMPGMIAETKIISISGLQWDTNLVSGQWEVMDPGYAFNPSLLFNADTGIQSMLSHDVVNPVMVGLQELPEIPGKKLYAIQAVLQGTDIFTVSYGLIANGALPITLWVDPKTFELERIVLVDASESAGQEDTTWTIDFWNFDRTFSIDPPDLTNG